MNKASFTIANIAGGNERTFRLVGGKLSKRAIQHARKIGYGGPSFDGPAAREAFAQWEQSEEARLNGDEE